MGSTTLDGRGTRAYLERVTIEDTPLPSASAERNRRRRRIVIALVVALAVLVAAATAVAVAATHRPHLEWYQAEGDVVSVPFQLGSGERLVWQRIEEGDQRIVVDLMVISTVPPGVPRTLELTEGVATFELDAPVGDREVVSADGAVLRASGGG